MLNASSLLDEHCQPIALKAQIPLLPFSKTKIHRKPRLTSPISYTNPYWSV